MENHIETNFREIQKILDSCIAHDYKTKVDALFLKREYLTQAQLKDYLRQEIFRVTENIVACLLYTSPSPRDVEESRMPSSA